MNRFKNIALTALFSLGTFFAVTFTACNKDECKDVICNNGGTCVGGTCNCVSGYEGTNCQTLWTAKYDASFRATTEACTISGGNSAYTITIDPSATSVTTLLITNLYAAGKTTTANLTSSTAFDIPSQPFGTTGTISGNGTFSGNQITISYSVTAGGQTDVCNNVNFLLQ